MKQILSKVAPLLVLIITAQILNGFVAVPALTAFADSGSQLDTYTQQIAALNKQIAQYKAELSQVGANKKTLQNAIKSLDLQRNVVQAQVNVIQNQISSTQTELQQLSGQLADTQKSIAEHQDGLTGYIQSIYQSDKQPVLFQLVSSNNLSDFWQNLDQTVQVQNAVEKQTEDLKTEKDNLTNTQAAVQQKEDTLNAQNQSLAQQQQSLNATVASKSQLLSETNAKESEFQKLLAQAQAQLQSFSNFTKNAGGAKLLANQTSCDSWGCYYNQRDVAWGASSLDGTNYTLASDGCLITAMAMVMTHYGYKSVTPATINSNSNNFASYYPAYLLYTISAGGATATRQTAAIDSTLATGNPVVIGMRVYGGTHFVVLVSGRNGNYVMRDPYLANGKDINFSDHYSLGEIYSISRVIIGS